MLSFYHILSILAMMLTYLNAYTQTTPRRISQPGSFGTGQGASLFPGHVTRYLKHYLCRCIIELLTLQRQWRKSCRPHFCDVSARRIPSCLKNKLVI